MPITLQQQISSVYREIALRERVYGKWVESGRMTKSKADHEIACMKAVAETLMALAAERAVLGGVTNADPA